MLAINKSSYLLVVKLFSCKLLSVLYSPSLHYNRGAASTVYCKQPQTQEKHLSLQVYLNAVGAINEYKEQITNRSSNIRRQASDQTSKLFNSSSTDGVSIIVVECQTSSMLV